MLSEKNILTARFLGCGHVAPDPMWRLPSTVHAIHELIMVVDGRMTVADSRGRQFEAGAGDVWLYPAGAAHAEWSDSKRPLESFFLSFSCSGLSGMPLVKAVDSRGCIERMCLWLYGNKHMAHPVVPIQRDALLRAILAEFLLLLDMPDMPMVVRTRQHIRAHIGGDIRLEELAELNGVSKYHFLRQYRVATGRTPGEEVRLMRAEAARDLLLGTSLPLKEIADRVGFGDVYGFSRAFRRLFNAPPARYRAMHGEKTRS